MEPLSEWGAVCWVQPTSRWILASGLGARPSNTGKFRLSLFPRSAELFLNECGLRGYFDRYL